MIRDMLTVLFIAGVLFLFLSSAWAAPVTVHFSGVTGICCALTPPACFWGWLAPFVRVLVLL